MGDFSDVFGDTVNILEGAMGTMLIGGGADPSLSFEGLNIDDPERVATVHRLYRAAGADWAIANTFGATRNRLAGHGRSDEAEELNRAGVRIAEVENPDRVLGDIGPCGLGIGLMGTATFDEAVAQYAEQITALVEAGCDALLIETMIDISDARAAIIAAREVLEARASEIPIIATCSFAAGGRMALSATSPEAAAVILEAAGADAVGMNCGLDSEHLFPLMQKMARATALPLIVQPNAGMPRTDAAGASVYDETPEQAASWAVRFRDLGVQLIGSCCGTTPAFTSAIAACVKGASVPARTADGGAFLATSRDRVACPDDALPELEDFTFEGYAADDLDGLESDLLRSAAIAREPLCFPGVASPLLERALRVYPGRALVLMAPNSSEEERAEVTRIADRYGALLR